MIIDYQIVSGDDGKIVKIDSSNGIVNVKLPSPTAGFKITIKDFAGSASINRIYIIRNGSELIDGVQADTSIDENFMSVSLIADGTNWSRFDSHHGQSLGKTGRGLFAGGVGPSNVIDYIEINTLANATDFGDLTSARQGPSGISSQVRAVFGGGSTGSVSNILDYVAFATTSNAVDFGDLTSAKGWMAACASQVRGIFAGGYNGSSVLNNIDYITTATLSNANSFGTLGTARFYFAGCGSSTRGIFGGGLLSDISTRTRVMDYITIATLGNSVSFGNLSSPGKRHVASCSNSIRGLWAGGEDGSVVRNEIDYVTIATASDAASFGVLSVTRYGSGGVSSSIRGVFGGGILSDFSTTTNVIDYVAISTLSNATDFGDLSLARREVAACSSSHGGLYV